MTEQELSNSLTQFRKTAEEYQSESESFRRLSAQLRKDMLSADTMWQGEAKDAFVKSMAEKLDELDETVRELQELSDSLNMACREYTACGENISTLIQNLKI